ncbi:MAG: hypothetical protein ACK559_25060, partial [bacterium]
MQTKVKAARADFGSQVEEAMYLGSGGEHLSGKTGYVLIKVNGKEKVMRVSSMTVIPEVPIIELEEDLKDWKRHTDPEGKVFWKNERTGKKTRTLPKFEQEDP